jgi:hypothetical protein
MVTAIARTIPKTNVSDFRVRAMVHLLAPDRSRSAFFEEVKKKSVTAVTL